MKILAAKFISVIFHPLVFTLVLPFIVIYNTTGDIFSAARWTFFSLLFVLAAVITFFILRPSQVLHDFDISERKNRPLFYGVTLVFALIYVLIAIIFRGIFSPVSIVGFGIMLAIITFDFVNKKTKASVHGGVAMAYLVTVSLLFGWRGFLTSFYMPLLLGWSRVTLKKHTVSEYIIGAALGGVITLITFIAAKVLL